MPPTLGKQVGSSDVTLLAVVSQVVQWVLASLELPGFYLSTYQKDLSPLSGKLAVSSVCMKIREPWRSLGWLSETSETSLELPWLMKTKESGPGSKPGRTTPAAEPGEISSPGPRVASPWTGAGEAQGHKKRWAGGSGAVGSWWEDGLFLRTQEAQLLAEQRMEKEKGVGGE